MRGSFSGAAGLNCRCVMRALFLRGCAIVFLLWTALILPGESGVANQPALLGRLSSGGLLRLDQDGDLVETPSQRQRRISAQDRRVPDGPGVALDSRVGLNTRLGDDPAALPPNMRAQAEPHIIRSPVASDYLLGTFQEGRFTDGSAVNCGYSVSRDGGLSWTRALIPGLTASSGGPYNRATDPVAGVAANGHAFLNTLSAGQMGQGGNVLVSRSINGDTFANPLVAFQSSTTFPDKNWMAINTFPGTFSAGRIAVTFTLFPAGLADGPHPIMRVLSDDGGQTWGPAAFVHSSALQVQGSQPVFLPDGRLAIVYWNFNNTEPPNDDFIEMVLSADGGVTFGAPTFVTAVNFYDAPAVRDGGFLPSVTTDRTSGALYLVFQALHNGAPRIMFTKSADAGVSWSTPAPISDNPPGSSVFNAAISASPDGQRLAVVYYDTRHNPGSSTLVDVYVAYSFSGGATWQPSLRTSSVSTDATLAPLTGAGYMLGDYQGIAEATNASVPAVPIWIDTRTTNPDPFAARVRIVPPFAELDRPDFNQDNEVDIVWQNNATGQRAVWFMNNATFAGEAFLPTVELAWQIAGTGDFNRDTHTDLLWQNNVTGQRAVWFMNGATFVGEAFLVTIPTEWQIAATGEFNGDGHVDIVWENTRTGERSIWLMNGTTLTGDVFLPTVSPEWQIAGAADFNRDGQTDLLWQNLSTGQRSVWFMNGTSFTGDRLLLTIPPEWRIAGAGEFNGDGQSDLLWQRLGTGQRAIWFMNETVFIGEAFLPTVPTPWEIRNR